MSKNKVIEIKYNKEFLEKKIKRTYDIYSWQLAHGYVWGYLNALHEVKKITQETMWEFDIYSFKLCEKIKKFTRK